jgi:hypothetical protein
MVTRPYAGQGQRSVTARRLERLRTHPGVLQCRMDREMLEQRLTAAEEHAALGERHIVRQRALVAEPEQKGADTTEASRLLASFEQLQVAHLAECDRLRRQLDA